MSPRQKVTSPRRRTKVFKKRKATPRQTTSSRTTTPPVKSEATSTPVKGASQRDKVELSPTSQAKCQTCKRKIMKGCRRIGIESSSPRFGIYHKYYHEECLSTTAKQNLRLGGATPQQLISQQLQSVNESNALLRKRAPLRENLRLLRSLFAKRLNYAAFCVFKDETLDELVTKMPRTKKEFLEIRGMGPKKYQSFGQPFLQAIAAYRVASEHTSASGKGKMANGKPVAKHPEVIDLVDDPVQPTSKPTLLAPERTVDDDTVVLQASLTMEQIVEEKFKHAQENGYVISVDL